MSLRLTSLVWDNSPHSGSMLLLQLALADYANDEGACYGSYKSLADKSRCSSETVRVHIQALLDEGWLEVKEHGRGPGHATRYQITVQKICTVPSQPSKKSVGNHTDLPGNHTDLQGGNGYRTVKNGYSRASDLDVPQLGAPIRSCKTQGCAGGWIENADGAAVAKCPSCYPSSVSKF